MRVTFILPYAGLSGGIRVVAIYADRLKRRGHDVQVVSTARRTIPFQGKVRSLLRGEGWPRDPANEPSYFAGLDVPHRVLPIYRPIVDSDLPNADVVVATWWETAEWVGRLSPDKGAKAYFIQHHEIHPGQPVERVQATWRLPMHKIVISRWLVDLARDQYHDTDVSHVPNSVDTSQFFARARGQQEQPTVGLLYSQIRWKGVDVSLAALQAVQRRLPALRLMSFGAERPTPELPLPANAEFSHRPAQEAIRNIYAGCDVWLCGSRAEGFHLPPLEAMACRCPVVSTRVGGPVDVIEDGVNGYLANVEDSSTLADRLVQVLSLPEASWRNMSDAAYSTSKRYTWDDATELLERALEIAIERGGHRSLAALPKVRTEA